MKRLAYLMVTVVATVLTMVAMTTSAGACFWGAHQPKEPDILG